MGCEALGESPSMVTILSPALRLPSGTEQERCSSPLICTEQAPHCATPQPYLVPVRPTCSRMTHRSGVSASACTSHVFPVTLGFAMRVLSRLGQRHDLGGCAVASLSRPHPSGNGGAGQSRDSAGLPRRALIAAHRT